MQGTHLQISKTYTVKRRGSWTSRELLSSLWFLDVPCCYSLLRLEVHITSLCILNVTAIFSCEKKISFLTFFFFFRWHLWQRYRNILLFLKALCTATSGLRRTHKPVTTVGGLSLRKWTTHRSCNLAWSKWHWKGFLSPSHILPIKGGRDNQICKSPQID